MSGHLRIGAAEYESLSAAAKAVSGNTSEPGWEFWAAEIDGQRISLFDLRAQLRKSPAWPVLPLQGSRLVEKTDEHDRD